MQSSFLDDDLPWPLPIDWEIPTYRCKLAIRGTAKKIGYLDIGNTPVHGFLQPAIFPADIEVWPPGSRSEIVWLHYRGDPQRSPPTKKHPFDYDAEDWDSVESRYNINLIVEKGKEVEFVRNVMREFFPCFLWSSD